MVWKPWGTVIMSNEEKLEKRSKRKDRTASGRSITKKKTVQGTREWKRQRKKEREKKQDKKGKKEKKMRQHTKRQKQARAKIRQACGAMLEAYKHSTYGQLKKMGSVFALFRFVSSLYCEKQQQKSYIALFAFEIFFSLICAYLNLLFSVFSFPTFIFLFDIGSW
ncbi:hypothetical protein, unlikely [Trypanosoma brucei gambiense DAL972]|uniref:Uncharacterized protein n=1 Tax=Trypanosoma brucei gambiense (strain MHOM/CI/86/DAL972) TaxID=679716 RepID=D0A308_TRYB9|nr:hypothetical protein, unlikely [Trypanosoma brucei gambiense DAL972]CBH15652.1 hypothetical protein, unlikely [Trypanosoma brucei gambiense DAL972]|eukprot:XP_011777916.1 hypothetical protein, unlikely [Trypanosoma brucei gambiense DAL972]